MRILLDTHVFLWYISADPQLPVVFRDAIRDSANEVYLSAASVWEAVIKYALGKLPLPEYLPRQREAHRIAALPIEEAALIHLAGLPPLHRDPFDRILMAQALQHGLWPQWMTLFVPILSHYCRRCSPGQICRTSDS